MRLEGRNKDNIRGNFLHLLNLTKLYYRHYFNKSTLDELIFFVTYKCNFKCKTCFYVDVMRDKAVNADNELTIDEIIKISSSIKKFNNLLISGGEPFLREDLTEICKIFCFQNKIHNIHLPTNGFYTDKIYSDTQKILHKCPNINLTISLPLDGLQETHDRIKGIKGSFQKVIETAKKLSLLKKEFNNLNLYIITVVNSINLNEIIELSEFIKNNLPIDGHGPSPMRGDPYDKTILPPTYKEWDNLSKKMVNYYEYWNNKSNTNKIKAFLVTNRIRYLNDLYTYVLKNKKLPFRCQAGSVICVLEPNGGVRLCELTEVVGNVKSNNYDFKKILFSDKANNVRKGIKSCACTHACFLNPSIELNLPSLIKSYFWGKL